MSTATAQNNVPLADSRHSFEEPEHDGLIGTIKLNQIVVIGAMAVAVVVLGLANLLLVALPVGIVGLVIAFGRRRNRTYIDWLPVVARFWWRKFTGKNVWESPTSTTGHYMHHQTKPAAPPEVGKVEILVHKWNQRGLGVLFDRRSITYTGVLVCRVTDSFLLQHPDEQLARVSDYGRVLAGPGQHGSPILRTGWIQRQVPRDSQDYENWAQRNLLHDPDCEANGTNEKLMQEIGTSATDHEVRFVVTIGGKQASRFIRQSGGGHEGGCAVLGRELEHLSRSLSEINGVRVKSMMSPALLAEEIRLAYEPATRDMVQRYTRQPDSPNPINPWPTQKVRENWTYIRVGDVLHRTFYVESYPKVEVHPDVLYRLLAHSSTVRTMATVHQVIPPDKAMRKVENDRVDAEADSLRDEQQGRLTSIAAIRRKHGFNRRGSELTDNHGDTRHATFVTISIRQLSNMTDREALVALDNASFEFLNDASHVHFLIQPCNGWQPRAFTYTLPLTRGLN